MNSLKLDNNFDLVLVDNDFVEIQGRDAIRQHLACRFGIFLGEFIYDTAAGVPWYQDILIKNPQFAIVSADLKRTVLDTPGITDLLSFDFSFDNGRRMATLDFKAQSTNGVIDFTQEVAL